MKVCRIAILIVAISLALFARVDQWPLVLSMPEDTTAGDTAKVKVNYDIRAFEETVQSDNVIEFRRRDSLRTTTQRMVFIVTEDRMNETRDQYVNLAGGFRQSGLRNSDLSIGMDWKPEIKYNSGPIRSAFLTSTDIGPVIGVRPLGVQIDFEGGVSGRGYNDSLKTIGDLADSIKTDAGIYSGVTIGSLFKPIGNLPVYIFANAYGRLSEEVSRFVAGRGSILCPLEVPGGDSVYVYYADSVTSGREGDLKDVNYINVPSRISRSFLASAGYKFLRLRSLSPALVVSLSQNQVSYRDTAKTPWDRRNTSFSSILELNTKSTFSVEYGAGVVVGFDNHDKLFADKELGVVSDSSNSDSLWANLDDYHVLRIDILQSIAKWWNRGFGAEYALQLSRVSTEYPNFFITHADPTDTTRRSDNNHWVTERHRARVVPLSTEKWKIELLGTFLKSTNIYLDSIRSASNSVDRTYIVGTAVHYSRGQRFKASESVQAKAIVREHDYPHMYEDIKGPPYSRTFSSDFNLEIFFGPRVSIMGELDHRYRDGGYWNDPRYIDADDGEFYAIQTTSLEYLVGLTSRVLVSKDFIFGAGAKLKDINYKIIGQQIERVKLGVGLVFMPHVSAKINLHDKVKLDATIGYIDQNLGGYDRYLSANPDKAYDDTWDIQAQLEVSF